MRFRGRMITRQRAKHSALPTARSMTAPPRRGWSTRCSADCEPDCRVELLDCLAVVAHVAERVRGHLALEVHQHAAGHALVGTFHDDTGVLRHGVPDRPE